jgi:uncharacterized protein (TIGR03086 family)
METIDLRAAAQRLGELVAGVSSDQLGDPTPCPAYTLGDLIGHIGGLALAFRAAAAKENGPHTSQGPSGNAARLGPDWRDRIPRDLAALARAWLDPAAWDGMTRIAGMEAPGAMVGLTVADELAVHGWDMARATGQEYSCDPAVLTAAESFLEQFTSPGAPAGPEVAFGPPRPAAAGAPRLVRVVALAGRDPAWSAR